LETGAHLGVWNWMKTRQNSCGAGRVPVSRRSRATTCLSLRVGNDVVTSVNAVRDLDVTLDSELTMQRHVNKFASACFYHIRRLKQIRRLIGPEVTATLMSAFVLSKLNYCNAILPGLPKSTIAPLQHVLRTLQPDWSDLSLLATTLQVRCNNYTGFGAIPHHL